MLLLLKEVEIFTDQQCLMTRYLNEKTQERLIKNAL
jgi:hypothetical protein